LIYFHIRSFIKCPSNVIYQRSIAVHTITMYCTS